MPRTVPINRAYHPIVPLAGKVHSMPARKSTRRQPPRAAGRVKKTFTLDAELARLLALLAAHSGRTESELVAEAVRPIVAGYYLARKGSGDVIPCPSAEPSSAA